VGRLEPGEHGLLAARLVLRARLAIGKGAPRVELARQQLGGAGQQRRVIIHANCLGRGSVEAEQGRFKLLAHRLGEARRAGKVVE
jgi:hypothetical protein